MSALKQLWTRPKLGPIGLDVSLEQLHGVQLATIDGGGTELIAARSEPLAAPFDDLLSQPKALKHVISKVLAGAPFAGRGVVTVMPASMTQVMSVNYEVTGGQSDAAAISRLLVDRIGDELGEFVVDFMPISLDHRVSERAALISLCRRDRVMAYLNALVAARLKPLALEIGPVAIKRLVDMLQRRRRTDAALVVNCGRERSFLTLIAKNQLLSDDEVDFGESTVLNRVSAALDVPAELALRIIKQANFGAAHPDENTRTLIEIMRGDLNVLVDEIQRGLVYATTENRGRDDTTVYLMGSIANWRGMDTLLTRLVNHDVLTIPDPLNAILESGPTAQNAMRPELAIATGLAIRGLTDG